MELLMIILSLFADTQADPKLCEAGFDVTLKEAVQYSAIIGVKEEWSNGEQPEWYTSLIKNSASRTIDLLGDINNNMGDFCGYIEDVNHMLTRSPDFPHLIQNVLIGSFNDCDGISPAQLEMIDSGGYDISSTDEGNLSKSVMLLTTQKKIKDKYSKNYCALMEFTYDAIYKRQYDRS